MNRVELLAFLRSHKWAVQSSISATGLPQAAVVGFAVTDKFEIIFDTLDSSRKSENLRANPGTALVIGGLDGDERTVQFEGSADFPQGEELRRVQAVYFQAFPDGPSRLSWTGITYVRVRPRWLRFSDFSADPPLLIEFPFENTP